MKQMKNKLMNISIRNKLILSYLSIALIPFFIFSIISITIFTNNVEENISQQTNQLLGQVKTAMEVHINSLEELTNYISTEIEDVQFSAMSSEEDIFWRNEDIQINKMLNNIAKTHREVAGILIATENDMYVSTGMTRISRDSFTQEEWYRQAFNNPNEIQIISNITGRNIVTDKSYSVDDVFSVSKAIINVSTGDIMGVILMDIRHNIISKSIESITIGQKGFIFVMDDSEQVVYTPPNAVTYRVNPDWIDQSKGKPINAMINNEKYQIRYEVSKYTDWKVVGVFSQDEIMGSINTMLLILIGFLIIMVICIISISLKIAQTITNPIVKLKKAMKKVETGDLTVRFNVHYQDEISELGRNFNLMITRIEELVELVYMEQQSKRTAELRVLQEQIKPHFLYNTLDTISWMAREYEAYDIVRLVDALTNMFRIGLNHGNDYISVKDEVKYVSNYLYIQKIRYRTKLNYEIFVDEMIEGYIVPKFILQPLVENAIYHGIKTKRGDGHLLISAKKQDEDTFEFTIEDDGSGMEEAKVKELNILLNQPSRLEENQSFGLFYIKERLRFKYGDDFNVKVESAKDQGTKVTITIKSNILNRSMIEEGKVSVHE